LIEVVMAMFILVIGATTILGMLSFGAGAARTASLRSAAASALPGIVLDLQETLFPLVIDSSGADVAAEPPPERDDIPVPGFAGLSYSLSTRALPAEGGGKSREYVVDIAIHWQEGGKQRSQVFRTILLREVPFGERLRRRFVEGLEPMTSKDYQATLRAASERNGVAPKDGLEKAGRPRGFN